MDEGTIFLTTQFPVPWPVKSPVTLIEQSHQGQEFKLHAYPDGHISFENKGASNPFDHHVQPITFARGAMVMFNATWKGNDVDVRMNGIALCQFGVGIETANLPGKPYVEQPFELSIHHSDARSNCAPWIAWRRANFFEVRHTVKEGRRSKTTNEQLNELENELQALQELSEQVRAGKKHMLTKVAGSLRALVYWQVLKNGDLNASYNPLLFRLASRLDLPLPVFTSPPDPKKLSEIIDKVDLHYSPASVSLTRTIHFQVVLDLQDWLLKETIEVRTGSADHSHALTCKDVILQCSNTLGGSHFDEDVPIALDTLQGTSFRDKDSLAVLLLTAADVVCGLGEYVITASMGGASESGDYSTEHDFAQIARKED